MPFYGQYFITIFYGEIKQEARCKPGIKCKP